MYQRIQFDIHLRQHKKHTVCLCVVLKPQEVEKLIERITAYRVSSSLRDTASKLQGILQLLIFKCLKVQEAEAGSAKKQTNKRSNPFQKQTFLLWTASGQPSFHRATRGEWKVNDYANYWQKRRESSSLLLAFFLPYLKKIIDFSRSQSVSTQANWVTAKIDKSTFENCSPNREYNELFHLFHIISRI